MSTTRTYCGTPTTDDTGSEITVYGWVDRRRDHGGLIFLDIRDVSGVVQVVLNPDTASEAHEAMRAVRLEYVVQCTGVLKPRGPEQVNPKLGTGAVEIHATSCRVLSVAKTPPFPVNEDSDVDEKLRLQYRYLDLRRPRCRLG